MVPALRIQATPTGLFVGGYPAKGTGGAGDGLDADLIGAAIGAETQGVADGEGGFLAAGTDKASHQDSGEFIVPRWGFAFREDLSGLETKKPRAMSKFKGGMLVF